MNTILFDLDGTLLPLNMEEFTQAYFSQLAIKLSDHINPEELSSHVWGSTKYMVKNLEPNKTNKEAFFEDFKTRVDNDLNILHPIFEEFYKEDFKGLKSVTNPTDLSKKIVDTLKEKGYELVIATNPMFPRDAIYHRVEWAGLEREDFKLITTYEDMHFCKPNVEYYQEILSIIGKRSEEVMMVGNDAQEDIIASKLGIKTFLVNDYLIDRKVGNLSPDYEGTLEDFYNFVLKLPIRGDKE